MNSGYFIIYLSGGHIIEGCFDNNEVECLMNNELDDVIKSSVTLHERNSNSVYEIICGNLIAIERRSE